MDTGQIALLMVPAMLVFVMLGVPFFAAIGGVGLFFGLYFFGWGYLPNSVIKLYTMLTEPSLVALPMFVLLGTLLGASGLAELTFDAIYKLFGRVRGGLLLAVGVVCTLLAACTGIAAGALAVMATAALPIMLRRKYSHGLACGTISAAGTLGTIIPPSVILIIYAMFTELSVGKLYFAAFIPGLLLSALFIVYELLHALIIPSAAPAAPPEELVGAFLPRVRKAAISIIPLAVLIVAVLGSIFAGVATPTEAAGMGAFGALLLVIAYRKFSWKGLMQSFTGALRITGMIGGMIIGALLFSNCFLSAGGASTIKVFLDGLGLGPTATIWILLFVVFLLGFVMDISSIIFICVPIFTPLLIAYGINPLWFAMLVIVTGQMAYITPPYAPGIFILKAMTPPEVTLGEMYKGIIPFVFIDWLALALVFLFPALSLWLPAQMIE